MDDNILQRPQQDLRLANKMEERSHRHKPLLGGSGGGGLVGVGEAFSLLAIFVINLWLLLPFFGGKDYINVFSAPFLPALVGLSGFVLSDSEGIRFWTIVFLLSLPLAYYFLFKEITGRKMTAILSCLILSLPVAVFAPARIDLAIFNSDAAQLSALTLSAFVALLLLKFLKGGSFGLALLASCGIVLVGLTSPLGLMVLFFFLVAITFSEMLLGKARVKLLRFVTVMVIAGGLSAFWYNPSFVMMTIDSNQGKIVVKTLINLLPISFFAIPLFGAFGYLLFENRPQLQPLSLALIFTLGFTALSFGAGVFLPMPSRFLPSLGVSLSFLIAVIITFLFDFLQNSSKLKKYAFLHQFRTQASVVFVALCILMLSLIVIFSGSSLRKIEQNRVLGLADGKRTGIWEIREQTGSLARVTGGSISLSTIILTAFLSKKLKENSLE